MDSGRIAALRAALHSNLDFHGTDRVGPHTWHSFPARFPPQLPNFLIRELSEPGEIVLDPMLGSGTTLIEAVRLGRYAVGCDIDPLARMIASAKLSRVDPLAALREGNELIAKASDDYHENRLELLDGIQRRFDSKTHEFINYWFPLERQLELLALVRHIEAMAEGGVRGFLQVVFSSIIIAKSGGVSLARDLAHTRPHRDPQKAPRSAISEFGKRLKQNVAALGKDPLHQNGTLETSGKLSRQQTNAASIYSASASHTKLPSSSIDLVVTSPPYANNAIDYMRAHKFSLVWFGWKIADLAKIRAQYVGHDALGRPIHDRLPDQCEGTIARLTERDKRKASVLRRYFWEMSAIISEMWRVLRAGRPAVIVVGSSKLRGLDVETHKGLAAIGENAGFTLAGIGARRLDRDRRMMPARWGKERQSQIEERMHEEHVIGLLKS